MGRLNAIPRKLMLASLRMALLKPMVMAGSSTEKGVGQDVGKQEMRASPTPISLALWM
jgi:hypothetical protein